MVADIENLRKEFDRMGLKDCVEVFLSLHPDCLNNLTHRELHEQILFRPDAVPASAHFLAV